MSDRDEQFQRLKDKYKETVSDCGIIMLESIEKRELPVSMYVYRDIGVREPTVKLTIKDKNEEKTKEEE